MRSIAVVHHFPQAMRQRTGASKPLRLNCGSSRGRCQGLGRRPLRPCRDSSAARESSTIEPLRLTNRAATAAHDAQSRLSSSVVSSPREPRMRPQKYLDSLKTIRIWCFSEEEADTGAAWGGPRRDFPPGRRRKGRRRRTWRWPSAGGDHPDRKFSHRRGAGAFAGPSQQRCGRWDLKPSFPPQPPLSPLPSFALLLQWRRALLAHLSRLALFALLELLNASSRSLGPCDERAQPLLR